MPNIRTYLIAIALIAGVVSLRFVPGLPLQFSASEDTLPQSLGADSQPQSTDGTDLTAPPARLADVSGFDFKAALGQARQTVLHYKRILDAELSVAIKTDGPAHAVPLCQTVAPKYKQGLKDIEDLELLRTSLRLSNPENAPNEWERKVLLSFTEKAEAGAAPAALEHYAEVVTPEGDRLFRYMRAIPVGEMCLTCHGENLRDDVKDELTRYYPDYKATGYRLGELRGAYSLTKTISQ